ncbi:MAG: protein translocase subunit SecF, partial [Elusimicrobia bacterium]|nr:protein translocase subunit SecF [Elusimicrobiota bacterium]
GYSINDTIVIFDRMRENLKVKAKLPLYDLINVSLNETLSRTLITNLTVFLAIASLLSFGGEVINDFAFAMFWGSIAGTYSTIAIATPLVYEWESRKQKPQLRK